MDVGVLISILWLYYIICTRLKCVSGQVEGRPSLKLEGLSMANQLVEGPAHQAIVDVGVTVALARLFKRNATIWDFGFDAFNKAADEGRVQKVLQAQTTLNWGYCCRVSLVQGVCIRRQPCV